MLLRLPKREALTTIDIPRLSPPSIFIAFISLFRSTTHHRSISLILGDRSHQFAREENRFGSSELTTMESGRKPPSLVDLCAQLAIDNLRYIGDVGDTDSRLLETILPHCTVDQLSNIEESTVGRDLSPVTDKLWKRFYGQHFGEDSVKLVVERMKQKQVVFKWRKLYEAKTKERESARQKCGDKLRKRYAQEEDKKRSRQVKICSKAPPARNKRSFSGGSSYNLSGVKSNIMKKAKLEYLTSHEAQVHATMRRNTLQRMSQTPQSKPGSSGGSCSASGSKAAKPLTRR